ncbi:MAG: FGGY family carbohydrate kinase [Rectinemataceae bacterium]|jgi:xylulokinase
METHLGFDFGTTSIKASVIDGTGRVLARARVPCETVSPRPGWFEVDPEAMWRRGLARALTELGSDLVGAAGAVCVSSVCASFVPVDARLNPLYNAVLYGIDTRATAQVARLNASLPKESLARIAGTGFTSHSVLPKLLWFKEELPEVYARSALFLESSNYISSLLTGETAWDGPSAAGGHMLDLARGEYPNDLIEGMGLDPSKLPRLANPLEVLGRVTRRASVDTGIPEGIPVLVGACDVNAEAFAVGAFDPGDLLFVYGSTISTLFTLGSFESVPGFVTGPSVLEGTWRVGGATSSGGRYLDWVRDALGLAALPLVEGSRGPTGLLMLPYLDGARVPFQDPGARVAWYGMTSSTGPTELWKASMESMGYELALILDRFGAASALPAFAHAMGGLSSNRDFLTIVADVTGLPQRWAAEVDASYGDALMALSSERGLGEIRAILASRENAETVVPDPALHELYAPFIERYAALNAALLGLSSRLCSPPSI